MCDREGMTYQEMCPVCDGAGAEAGAIQVEWTDTRGMQCSDGQYMCGPCVSNDRPEATYTVYSVRRSAFHLADWLPFKTYQTLDEAMKCYSKGGDWTVAIVEEQ
jgi:hypothetical protein